MRKKKNTLQNVIVWLIVACTVFPFLYVILGSLCWIVNQQEWSNGVWNELEE